MTVARTFRALELYDILANLVPGAVLLLSVDAIFRVEDYVSFSNGAFMIGVFLIVSLVSGHVIQTVASLLNGTPQLFGNIIKVSQGEEVEGVEIEITHIEEALWPLMQQKFALPDDFDDYGELFRLLLSYIETTPATRALRFQALHSFHRSIWAVGFVTASLTLVGMLLKCMDIVGTRPWTTLGLSLAGSFLVILVFQRRKEKMNKRFIQYAIVDFYSDQMDELNSRGDKPGS